MKLFLLIIKAVLCGVVWTISYIVLMNAILIKYWNFNLTKYTHWQLVFNSWKNGWVIDEPKEIAFFVILFCLIPVWIAFLILFYKINYIKILKKIFVPKKKRASAEEVLAAVTKKIPKQQMKKKKKKKKSDVNLPASPPLAPAKASEEQTQTVVEEKSFTINEAFETEVSSPVFTDATSDKVVEESKSDEILAEIRNIAQSKGYIVYSEMEMGAFNINLVLISAKKIFLISLSPDAAAEWVADEESFTDEPPVWFSEDNFEVSPVYKTLEAQALLEEMLAILIPESQALQVYPVVIVASGVILNGSSMINSWKEYGATVSRYASGKPDELPNFVDILEPASNSGEIPDDILNFVSLALVSVAPDRIPEE